MLIKGNLVWCKACIQGLLLGLIVTPMIAMADNIGYYDMSDGAGDPSQVQPIIDAGHTPVMMNDLTTADLVGIDVLFVQNPSNGSYGAEYLSRLTDINTWVGNGGILVLHDRYVDVAETILPGGAGFNIVRDFTDDADIDVLDNTTLVTNGPGGLIDNTSLDGGNSSSHGFAIVGSLPGNGTFIFSRSNPTEIVTFSYTNGTGAVVYSSIPLDFYLGGSGNNPPRDNMTNIYAPNVLAYGVSLRSAAPIPTVSTWGLLLLVSLLGLFGLNRRKIS